MRTQLTAALGLLLVLQAAGPLVDPTALTLDQVHRHLGETVHLEGRVEDVEPGRSVHRVTLVDAAGAVTVLVRGQVPPVGARLSVTGDLEGQPGGPVVWARGTPVVLEAPDPRPRSLATLLAQAPRLAGTPVAVTATWTPEADALTGEAGALPVRLGTGAPPPGPVLAWGSLTYQPQRAGYVLEMTGWSPWTPP